jgi:hypothetical protein
MKRAGKEHPLLISDILRNKRINSKKVLFKLFYSVIKRIFKEVKVLTTTVQRVNLKKLCTVILL